MVVIRGGEGLERRYPSPLAQPVDRGVDHVGPALHRGEAVGHRHAEVVMGVYVKADARHSRLDLGEDLPSSIWREDAHCVRYADSVGPRLIRRLHDLDEVVEICAGSVFRREPYGDAVGLHHGHHLGDDLEGLLLRLSVFVLEVCVADAVEHGDAVGLQRGCVFEILPHRAAVDHDVARDFAVVLKLDDPLNGGFYVGRHAGVAHFYHPHADV